MKRVRTAGLRRVVVAAVCCLLAAGVVFAADGGAKKETWDWAAANKEIVKKFKGTAGVVLHLGDSISYANQYSQWARNGKGKTAEDKAILEWMHCGKGDNTDGWWLTYTDAAKGRSHTAASGVTAQQYLKGGKAGLPALTDIIQKYNPHMVVVMLGTNDASQGRKIADYIKDMTTIIDALQANGTVVILSSIPPHCKATKLAEEYNAALYELAKEKKIPFLDLYGKIMELAPGDSWNGTILNKNDVHPAPGNATGEPTDENFKKSGYLLRSWMSVQKIREVKQAVLGK